MVSASPHRPCVRAATPQTHTRGFTLLEILVALVILSISIGVLMNIFSGGIKAARVTRNYNKAVFLAQGKMEELLLRKFNDEFTDSGVFEEDPDFRWDLEVLEYEMPTDEWQQPDESEAQIPQVRTLEITLRVSWNTGERTQTYSLTTLRTVKPYQEEVLSGGL
jgi:general secretion pathway protein I